MRLFRLLLIFFAISFIYFVKIPFANAQFNVPASSTWVTDSAVSAILKTPSTVYIAGSFSHVGPNTGTFAPVDTTSAQPLTNFSRVNGTVWAIVSDGSGGWYIGGAFTKVGSYTRNRIAHINSNGTVDSSWNPSANNTVFTLAISGTTLYVGGDFTSIGGESRNRIAAIDTSTGLATSWNPSSGSRVRTSALSGSTLYVGGTFTGIGGLSRNRIAALDTTTGSSTSWDPDANNSVITMTLSGTSTLYVGGSFTRIGSYGGSTRNRIAAIDTSTGSSTDWDPSANGTVSALVLDGTSTLYAGGLFTTIGAQSRQFLAALDTTTGAATSWNPNPNGTIINALALGSSTVYAGGDFTTIGGLSRNRIGALDNSAGSSTSWDPNADNSVNSLFLEGSYLYVGGGFSSIGRVARNRIAAIDTSTGSSTSWNPNANGAINALALGDSVIYAGGDFTSIGGLSRNRIAALDTSAGSSTSWNANADNTINTLALSGSTLYAGGDFTSIGGLSRNRIAAIDTSTGSSTSWNANADNTVNTLVLSGSTLYAGGDFTTIGGLSRNRIGALDNSAGSSTSWDPNSNNTVRALGVNGTNVYAGGDFTSIGGLTRNRIAGLNATTGSSTSWNANASGTVSAVFATGSAIYVGGSFTAMGSDGDAQGYFAQFDNPTIQFSSAASNGQEGSTATLELSISSSTTVDVTVDYAVSGGTATDGVDYTFTAGTATITEGNTTTNISFTTNQDALFEPSENVVITLSNPVNASLGTNSSHTHTITNGPAVSTASGGGGLPLEAFEPPSPPPEGFSVVINDRAQFTTSSNVTLTLNGGEDADKVALSNLETFEKASQVDYAKNKEWNLCDGKENFCENLPLNSTATAAVYAVFLTKWGQPSEIVSSSIIYQKSGEVVLPEEEKEEISPCNFRTPAVSFGRDLFFGVKGEDVKALQKFLNSCQEFQLAEDDYGSPGEETEFFGPLTKSASIKFQEAYALEILAPLHLAKGTGYFGPRTRAFINSFLPKQ